MPTAARAPYDVFEPDQFEYDDSETARGFWRRYEHANGKRYAEYISKAELFGVRLVHLTRGHSPETGKRVTARGVVAIGQRAVGVVAVGQLAGGVVAVGQLGVGLLLGLGQLSTGVVALGQGAVGLAVGAGQLASGYVAIGQLAVGNYALAQLGAGAHVWDTYTASEVAQQFFRALVP
ncbi:MAG: hypothetical protein DHS20C15_13210 [Planctomycetota bacterium]|nr:MAG: hypothetical protein DHS20C15_13210 [Planctomycetota bacterium]